ncbi:hypothetical protein [Neorhizobium tomejilense]|uniref:hypothetical protein n=1 Tax=Neorhizobium tomejilense TaxID=2093828 RepID=UPI003ECD4094
MPNESCIREWISATSGWAAVIAAVPTIWYLSRQVRDADVHQKTNFAIQLRRQRILATRTSQIAYVALAGMAKEEARNDGPDIRSWDSETVQGIIHHLRDATIVTFESEIAYPVGIGAWGTALVVERAFAGIEPALHVAPDIARRYFENLAKQAEEYLSDVEQITSRP